MLWEVLTKSFCVDWRWLSVLALTLACLVCPACESGVVIGSGCKNGVCPLVSGVDDCLVRSTRQELTLYTDPNDADTYVSVGTCLPTPLQRDAQGLVEMHVHWALPAAPDAAPGTPTHCDELPYLHAVNAAFTAQYRLRFPGREVCEVEQVPVLAGTNSTITLIGSGFFYDDFSAKFHDYCSAQTPGSVAFNNTHPPNGVVLMTGSDEVLATNGEPDSGRVCRVVGDVSQLGNRCLPSLQNYDQSQSILETRSAACGGNPCLAYHLEGSVATDCIDTSTPHTCSAEKQLCHNPVPCATKESLAKLAFCSCRCDAPEADAELCRCTKGFQCTPLITDGDPAIAGSYCVRSDVVASPDP